MQADGVSQFRFTLLLFFFANSFTLLLDWEYARFRRSDAARLPMRCTSRYGFNNSPPNGELTCASPRTARGSSWRRLVELATPAPSTCCILYTTSRVMTHFTKLSLTYSSRRTSLRQRQNHPRRRRIHATHHTHARTPVTSGRRTPAWRRAARRSGVATPTRTR